MLYFTFFLNIFFISVSIKLQEGSWGNNTTKRTRRTYLTRVESFVSISSKIICYGPVVSSFYGFLLYEDNPLHRIMCY